jgi:hypothetical protein
MLLSDGCFEYLAKHISALDMSTSETSIPLDVDARVKNIDAWFSVYDAKMEARFAALEKLLISTKIQAVYFCAALVIALFSALAIDYHWLASHEDQLIARSDQRFEAMEKRLDERDRQLDARQARSAKLFKEVEARLDTLTIRWPPSSRSRSTERNQRHAN